jgi:two-component system sensor histidine kinase KdpD
MVGARLDPEQLLQRTEDEARKESRGKLKIYLGAAPGVGKTYAMLHDALEKRDNDLDVVVGIAESHGRSDIESMLKNFEMIPRQTVQYRGKTCLEFDLDAALQRHPGLILIDEMAHSNAPGLRHAKRWQDIKEFLDRGIDVYTTLNVQHIESLKDDVAQIIQVPIRETVPDSMIEMANTIAVVDLPPEELLKRLHDGKIYIPQQAELATEHFFRKGNLIALRELALRITAERVGTDVLLYRQSEGIKQIWPTRDKILVCVGSRLESLKLIRAAKRMVTSLQAEWVAVYVDTPQTHASALQRNSAIQNLRLAEQLGAVTHVLTGFDMVKAIMDFAREQNVTQIMVRKHIFTRWRGWFRRSLADEIVRHSGDIDVYIMTGETPQPRALKSHAPSLTSWKPYGIAGVVISLATLFNIMLFPFLASSNLVMVYLLSLVVIARFGRIGLSIIASIISVLAYDFFFVPPFYSFSVSDIEYIFTLLVMLIVAQIISYLTILTRRQTESARLVQSQTTALYTLSRQLLNTRGIDKLVTLGVTYIAEAFNGDVMALLLKKNHLEIQGSYPEKQHLDIKERSIAQWVFEMGQVAGMGTDTLSFSKALYLPLMAAQGPIGVLRILPRTSQLFTPEQMSLLVSCVNQLALALEVDRMQDNTRKKELKIKTEKARITLLEAISNDLNPPLKIIISAAVTLKESEEKKTRTIGKNIDNEIEKLSQLNNNILRIIQLEFQDKKIYKKPVSLQEIIYIVIKASNKTLQARPVHTHFPESLPDVSVDKGLIQEVFMNLIDNAVKFTPPKSPLTILVYVEPGKVVVSVEDTGPGIALDEKDKLFEKFYRGKQLTSVRGLGLGLAICHKIIVAHGGAIWVENLDDSGAAFRFALPLARL